MIVKSSSDKGRPVVVMDSDEYKQKVSVLLNDTNTYLKITHKILNPTTSVEKDLNKLFLNIKEEKNDNASQIGPSLHKKLHCNNSTPGGFTYLFYNFMIILIESKGTIMKSYVDIRRHTFFVYLKRTILTFTGMTL